MKYKEWLVNNKEDAAKVTEFKSFGGNIKLPDGSIDVDKVMEMSIMMCSHNSDGTISMTLC